MKNYIHYIIGILSLALLNGCVVKDDTSIPVGDGLVHKVFKAVVEDGDMNTRTVLDETIADGFKNVLWEPGDVIGIALYDNVYQPFTSVLETPSANGVFEGNVGQDVMYYAIYPYTENQRMSSSLDVMIPLVQTYREDSFDRDMAPMIAMAEDGECLHFQNLCGVFALQLTGNDKIKSIKFQTSSGQKVSGECMVETDYGDYPILETTDRSEDYVILDCGDGVQIDESDVTTFYMVLAPGVYDGFNIIIETADGGYIVKSTDKTLVIDRSKITYASTLEFDCPVIGISKSEVKAESAVLTGTVNNQKDGYSYGFIYGQESHLDLENGTVLPCSSDGFSATVEGLANATLYYARAYCTNKFGTAYSPIIKFYTDYDSSSILLNRDGTANCYIVPEIGTYCFNASIIGNGNEGILNGAYVHTTDLDITPASVEVLWESKGANVKAEKEELLYNVILKDGYVFLTSTGLEGNALVAVKDNDGVILWSWHLWFTDVPQELTYVNYEGSYVVLDRNIGAIRADSGSDDTERRESWGAMYQWGRKDPFVHDCYGYYIFVDQSPWQVSESIKEPTNMSVASQSIIRGTHWTIDPLTDLWAEEAKTIYDPCPVGYKVADRAVWLGFTESNGEETNDPLIFNVSGNFNHGWNVIYDGVNTTWYPATDFHYVFENWLRYDSTCYLWSSTEATRLKFSNAYYNPANFESGAQAHPVRCMKYTMAGYQN